MLLENGFEILYFFVKIKSYPQYGIIDSILNLCTREYLDSFIDKNLRYRLNQ